MKLLFIQPHVFDGQRRLGAALRVFPWGFASVAAVLKNDGHEISVLDIYAQDLMKPEVAAFLDESKFDAACITGFASHNYLYVTWLAAEIKKRSSAMVVVGGLLANLHYDLLLAKGAVDVCVVGDGEYAARDLFRRPLKPHLTPGVACRRNGRVVFNGPGRPVASLDELPIPDFDLFDMRPYLNGKMFVHHATSRFHDFQTSQEADIEHLYPNMSLLAGKGCPYKCKFCSRSSDVLTLKSIDRIKEEITILKRKYGIKAVQFKDELLLVNKRRTRDICRALKELDVYWECQARINTVDREDLRLLRDSNCISVGFGVESGSDRMLRAMNKGVTRRQQVRVLRAAREAGMHLKLQLMCGYPGETKQSLQETASLFGLAGLPPRRLSWCTPMPGSELYEQVKARGLIGDEEKYVIELSKGWNKPGRIILNVSGQSDAEMTSLHHWVHIKMEWYYLRCLAGRPANLFRAAFWDKVTAFLVALQKYSRDHGRSRSRFLGKRLPILYGATHALAFALGGLRRRPVGLGELKAKPSFYNILYFK